jgi:hypothetical protein
MSPGEHDSGCLVCGAPLVYGESTAARRCHYCGAAATSNAACANGHFICDACHSGSANELIQRYCAASSSTRPQDMARELMRDRRMKMHGPEHHFLVPAVLVAAWANAEGKTAEERARLVAAARPRAEQVPGGFCGFNGACGAGIGSGIFVSLATGATPVAGNAWRQANLATAGALHEIAMHGGPRCCKRDTFLAIASAVEFARRELGSSLAVEETPVCEWNAKNRECLGTACAYHPKAQRGETENLTPTPSDTSSSP